MKPPNLILITCVLAYVLGMSGGAWAQIREFTITDPKKEAEAKFKAHTKEVQGIFKKHIAFDSLLKGPTQAKAYFKSRLEHRKNFLKQFIFSQPDSLLDKKRYSLSRLIKYNGIQITSEYQFSQREGEYPVNNPTNYWRLGIEGGASLLSLPLTLSYFRTTEQSFLPGQPMNRFTVRLDVETWREQIKQKADKKLAEIKGFLEVTELQDLDKLYDFYKKQGLDFLNTEDLQKELQQYYEQKVRDSIQNLPKEVRRKAEREFESKKDSLKRVAEQKIEEQKKKVTHKIDSLENLTQEKLENLQEEAEEKLEQKKKEAEEKWEQRSRKSSKKKTKKSGKKTSKFLKKQNINITNIEGLQRKYDSLRNFDPEKIKYYEYYMVLKAISEGQDTDIAKKLSEYGLLGKMGMVAGSIQKLEIGTVQPDYSLYTLKGIPVRGAQVELAINQWFLGWTGTKSLKAVPQNQQYNRYFNAFRVGRGLPQEDHVHFIYVEGKDDRNSLNTDSLRLFQPILFEDRAPRQNYLVAIHASKKLTSYLELESEIAYSVSSLNLLEQEIARATLFQVPDNRTTAFQQGWAKNLQLNWQIRKTTSLATRLEQIDAGYYNTGTPFLRNNIMGYHIKLSQLFWQGRLSISPSYGYYESNLPNQSTDSSKIYQYGAQIKYTATQGLFVQTDYQRHKIGVAGQNLLQMLNATTGYQYKIRSIAMQSNLTVTLQDTRSPLPDSLLQEASQLGGTLYSSAYIYQYTQVMSWASSFQCRANLSWRDIQGGVENGRWIVVGGEVGYSFFGKWQHTIGAEVGYTPTGEKKENITYTTGFQASSRIDVQARIQRNIFQGANLPDRQGNFKDFTGNLSVQIKL